MNEILVMRQFKLALYDITNIHSRLEISCYDRLNQIFEVLDECFEFYNNEFCLFKCPNECNFTVNDFVWQFKK